MRNRATCSCILILMLLLMLCSNTVRGSAIFVPFNASATFTAAVNANDTSCTSLALPPAIGFLLGGKSWKSKLAIVNVSMWGVDTCRFTLLATPSNITALVSSLLHLSVNKMRSLGISSISEDGVDAATPLGDNMWVLGVVAVGVAIAGFVVAVGERRVRNAKARRKARAATNAFVQDSQTTDGGMLADN